MRLAAPLAVFLVFAVLIAPAMAQDRFITDQLALDMRAGPGNQYRIERMVPAGTPVSVLDDDSGWSRVRLEDGAEGWVLSRLLADQPSARTRLTAAESALESIRREHGDSSALEDARDEVERLTEELDESRTQRQSLRHQLDEASEGLELYEENESLKKQVVDLRREIRDLERERNRLEERTEQRWFLAGGAVLVVGIILGLVLPRLQVQRRRGWSGGGL